MESGKQKSNGAQALLAEFFAQDDLKVPAADAGALPDCHDTFPAAAHYRPLGFTDPLFQDALRQGQITYKAGAIISQIDALSAGKADYVNPDGSDYRRRFAARRFTAFV